MRKFTKVVLIIAAIMFVAGVGCVMASFAMGLTWGKLDNMVKNGKFNFSIGNSFTIGESKDVTNDVEACRNLDVEFGAGALNISYADVEQIEVKKDGIKSLKTYTEGDTFYIEGSGGVGIHSGTGTVEVLIPHGHQFSEVDLEIGAGEVTIMNLDAQEMTAEVGAGQLHVQLVGTETDYNYETECGIGEIKIGANSVGGMGNTQERTNPGATRFLDLECGVGQIQIDFANKL